MTSTPQAVGRNRRKWNVFLPHSRRRGRVINEERSFVLAVGLPQNYTAQMERDIAIKLAQELVQDIVSERQVVYILIELRKLLEKKTLLNEERYRVLRLCSDWTVHPKLDRDSAQTITALFDRYETACRREPVGVSQAGIPELVEFCEHSRFRIQFIDACKSIGVAATAVSNDDWWRSFLAHFSEVVRDCPLEAKARNTTYVTRVTASAIDPATIGIINRQFAICWQWECRDRDTPGSVVSLF